MMEYYNVFMYTHLPITLGKNTIVHLPISMCGCSVKRIMSKLMMYWVE